MNEEKEIEEVIQEESKDEEIKVVDKSGKVALKKDGVTILRNPEEVHELKMKGWELV